MNYFIKQIAGTKSYSVRCPSPSKICGILMADFAGSVYGVKVRDKETFLFSCLSYRAKAIGVFLGKYDCEITELSKKGLPYFLMELRLRPGLILGSALALFSFIYGNGMVWDIHITGNDSVSAGEIEGTLSDIGFGIGKRYKAKELSSVCNKFIIRDDRFSRIAINMSGNAAFIEVTERTKKDGYIDELYYGGIVSGYDCIIERPEVICGTSLVKNGDTVEKGTMIISPVELGSNGNEYISGAKGKIYAVVEEYFTVTVPLEVTTVQKSDISETDYTVSFCGISASFRKGLGRTADNYFATFTDEKCAVSDRYDLPFRVRKVHREGYTSGRAVLTTEEATEKAYRKLYSKMSRDLADCEIISTESEVTESDGYLTLVCRAECIRNVALGIKE